MSERIVNDPSQHGWVEVDGKWVWKGSDGSGGGFGNIDGGNASSIYTLGQIIEGGSA